MYFKRFYKIKNKVFITWILSYLLVIAIPIGAGIFLYSEARKIILEEVNQVNQASLERVKSTFDSGLRDIRKTSIALSFDSNLNKVIYKRSALEASDFYSMYLLQNSMRRLIATNIMINDIFIYFERNGSILSHTYRIDTIRFGDIFIDEFQMTANEWIKLIGIPTRATYRIINFDSPDGTTVKKIIYVHPIQLINMKSPPGAIVTLIDTAYLEDIIKYSEWNNRLAAVIDENNEHIATSYEIPLPEFMKFTELETREPIFKTNYLNEEINVIHSVSEISGWRFALAVPTEIYMEKVEYIKLVLIIYIIIALLTGITISTYLSFRNYKPLKKLTQFAGTGNNKGVDKETNEYKMIEQIMQNLTEEKKSLRDRLEAQRTGLRENFLNRVAKGNESDIETIEDFCKIHDIGFISLNFVVLIFQLESISDMFSQDDPQDTMLIDFIIKMSTKEFADEKHFGITSEIDGRFCCIISISDDSDKEIERDINEIADRSVDFLEKKFGLEVTAAVSNIHKGYKGIPIAYTEAMEVIEYNELIGNIGLVTHYNSIFNVLQRTDDKNSIYSKERRLTNHIIRREFDETIKMLDDILENDIFESAHSLHIVKYRVFGLLKIVMNAIREIKESSDTELYDDSYLLERLIKSSSIKELREHISDFFNILSDDYPQANYSEIDEKFDRIKEYIKNNYFDPNISLSEISSTFEINTSYLSRMFKKINGIGMLDYIHHLRLDKAKELLNESDKSVREIAEIVGYINDIGLIRAFKRYEDTTPGKFREKED